MDQENYERLSREYAENYAEAVFYFCLRRTGNGTDAEDLSQEIAEQVCAALARGTVPEHFPAWVWQIARNRFSRWAEHRRQQSERYAEPEAGEDTADAEQDPAQAWVREEQFALLRRELAFIRREYREIVAAYYLEDRSVRDIAGELSLSEGTVKKRLERARNHLKEGMSMARKFGRQSYLPENVVFINNGLFGAQGEPWKYLERSLCKNLLLAAYRSPSTAEDLALELGVALPYAEEELDLLTQATLMRKTGNRYEPTFFIVSADAQEKVYAHLAQITGELTQAVIRTVEYETECKNRLYPGWHEGYQPYEDMKWALLIMEADRVRRPAVTTPGGARPQPPARLGSWGFTVRPNGGEWDILGLEICRAERPAFVGQHGCCATPEERELPEVDFSQYKFQYREIGRKTPEKLTWTEGQALLFAARGEGEKISPAVCGRLEKAGYLERKDGRVQPTFFVTFREKNPDLTGEEGRRAAELRAAAVQIAREHYLYCREQILKEIPDFLKNDAYQIAFACANLFDIRGAVLEEALRSGYITYAENDPRRMLGAVLKI